MIWAADDVSWKPSRLQLNLIYFFNPAWGPALHSGDTRQLAELTLYVPPISHYRRLL